ncbi:MAG: flippase [Anaerolineae bacterium]|nr:flippase [Anaerolineae bacterium]
MEFDATIDNPTPNAAPEKPETTETPGIFSSDTAKRAARNATALAASNLAAKGLLFLWQLLLARLLGTEGYGTYGTIGALLAVGASIPEFGMGLIVIRDIANRPKDAGHYLASTLTLQTVFSVIGYGVLMIAALLLGYDSGLRALLALAAVNLLVDSLGNMCHNQLLAMERMVIPAIIAAGHIVALVTLAGIILAAGGGLWGLYIATTIAGLLRAGVYWAVLLRFNIRPSFPVNWEIARALVINGAPIAATSFLSLAYMHSDKLITTALIGEESTGQLMAGFVIVFGVVELLSVTVMVAVFPLMSRTYGSGELAMFDFMIEKLSFFNLILSLPLAVYTSLLAVPLSTWIFGPDYTRTADVLQVLIWYTVVTMVSNVFSKAMLIQNRQTRLLLIRSGGLVINIMLNIILLPIVGIPGAAIATLIAESVILVLIVRSFAFPAEWWARVTGHLWRLALISVILAGIVFALREIHPLVAALIGVPMYGALVIVSGTIAKDDWDLIYRLAMAIPGGHVIGRYWKRELT